MKTKSKLPNVKECISYIEWCGWKLTNQYRTIYYFENPGVADLSMRQMRFTLTELRHAFLNGW